MNAVPGRRPGLAGLSFLATLLALFAFAANSILCRLALASGSIDPATFTAVRLASGAVALGAIVALRHGHASILRSGDFRSAFALFAYAILFAFAYVELPAGTGALLLFGAVQSTMIGAGLARGERVRPAQAAGIALALGGLVALVAPRLGAPSFAGALSMLAAGVGVGRVLAARAGGDRSAGGDRGELPARDAARDRARGPRVGGDGGGPRRRPRCARSARERAAGSCSRPSPERSPRGWATPSGTRRCPR